MPGRVLVVGLERELYRKIEPMLKGSLLSVDRVPKGESGMLLAAQATFDLIVVRYPLPDMAVGSFTGRVHEPGSANGGTPLMFLTDATRVEEVRDLLPGGRAQVLSVGEPAKFLQRVASQLLGAAARTAARVMVRLSVQLNGASTLVSCQSEDISDGGMLLRSEALYPIGTRLRFELTLPGDRMPIQGEAEVMRHSVVEVEGVQGMGLKFLSLKGDAAKRVKKLLSAPK